MDFTKSSTQLDTKQGWEEFFKEKIIDFPDLSDTNAFSQNALMLFRKMATSVPAYKDFLKKQRVAPEKIKTVSDLKQVPCIDKANYLNRYPLEALCWNGDLRAPIISSSSGSSGTPTFWPRSEEIELETSIIYELFLTQIYKIHEKKTLLINGFAMGIYIGGSFTLNACMRLSKKGYPLSIVTPGINKKDFLNSLERLHPYFDQVILGGYPPFIKDILDDCKQQGLEIPSGKLKLFLAAEMISETFRSYLYKHACIDNDAYYFNSMNLYGTADAAIAGHETPLTIFLSRLLANNAELCRKIFDVSYVPSLNMAYPFFKHMDLLENELLISTWNNAIPLCRYNIHDKGKLFTLEDMLQILDQAQISKAELEQSIGNTFLLPYQYVAVYGKSDNTASLYGLLIYPETIKKALFSPELNDTITGKFTMQTKLDAKQNQFLEIHIELLPNATRSQEMEEKIVAAIVRTLIEDNAEYRFLQKDHPERYKPIIRLHPYGEPEYFPEGIKQKWTR